MIVLDEQLMGRGLDVEIRRWHRGKGIHIYELRPGSVIKDDAIPKLLRSQSGPTFVTINVRDFWRRIAISSTFSFACFDLPDPQAVLIPDLLRATFRFPEFRIRQRRMGRVIRISNRVVRYYKWDKPIVLTKRLCG
jgi:hypothetical protein